MLGKALSNVDPEKESRTFILKGIKEPVKRVEFSPDGTTLLSVDAHDRVRLWDLETRETRWALDGTRYSSATFTPDGRHVLT